MTGKELAQWIKDNQAEDLEVWACYDPWEGPDGPVEPEIRECYTNMMLTEKKTVIFMA